MSAHTLRYTLSLFTNILKYYFFCKRILQVTRILEFLLPRSCRSCHVSSHNHLMRFKIKCVPAGPFCYLPSARHHPQFILLISTIYFFFLLLTTFFNGFQNVHFRDSNTLYYAIHTVNTFAASYLNTQGLNNSCLKSPASTLVDLTFQSQLQPETAHSPSKHKDKHGFIILQCKHTEL